MDVIKNMWYNFVLLLTQPTTYFEDKGSIKNRFIEAWLLGSVLIFAVSLLQSLNTLDLNQATVLLQLAIGAGLIFLVVPLTIGGWTAVFYAGLLITKSKTTFDELLRVYLKIYPLLVVYWSVVALTAFLEFSTASLATLVVGITHIVWLLGLGISRHEDEKLKAWVAPWTAVLISVTIVVGFLAIIEFVIQAPTI